MANRRDMNSNMNKKSSRVGRGETSRQREGQGRQGRDRDAELGPEKCARRGVAGRTVTQKRKTEPETVQGKGEEAEREGGHSRAGQALAGTRHKLGGQGPDTARPAAGLPPLVCSHARKLYF